jgi:hypothetical protein
MGEIIAPTEPIGGRGESEKHNHLLNFELGEAYTNFLLGARSYELCMRK